MMPESELDEGTHSFSEMSSVLEQARVGIVCGPQHAIEQTTSLSLPLAFISLIDPDQGTQFARRICLPAAFEQLKQICIRKIDSRLPPGDPRIPWALHCTDGVNGQVPRGRRSFAMSLWPQTTVCYGSASYASNVRTATALPTTLLYLIGICDAPILRLSSLFKRLSRE
jgi:hypothetical protein